ncbi:MAG: spore maturation protein [Clostridiales bacterium]|nr:spore maturation protein [Clostridiales bacterium]
MIVPVIIGFVAVFALHKKIDVFDALKTGASEGLIVTAKILPALVALLTDVYMLRAFGALDALCYLCEPLFSLVGIPPETASLIFIRPISGSGALAVGSELIEQYGPDSLIGRTAAVMLGSSETTFYVIAVYFGAVGIKKTRYAIPAALLGDITGFLVAALAVRLMY